MTTFTHEKLKKSEDYTDIDKYRVTANIRDYHIISRINLPKNHYSKIQKTIINVKKM